MEQITRIEDQMNLKNLRYEDFIRELIREKQRAEAHYREFKSMESDVLRMKGWIYALAACAVLAAVKAFF